MCAAEVFNDLMTAGTGARFFPLASLLQLLRSFSTSFSP
jgi:hypothetical protein